MQPTPTILQLLLKDHQHLRTLIQRYEALGPRAKVSKRRLANQLCQELNRHSAIEEQVLYPAIRTLINDDLLINEALVEHQCSHDLARQIESLTPDDPFYDARVKVLSEQIEHHLKEEEREIFPQVRHSTLDLIELGRQALSARNAFDAHTQAA